MMSEFDPKILAKLDSKYRECITEEMARLSKENDDLKIENKTIEKETMQQILGIEQNILDNTYRWELGPIYFICTMNELAFGMWAVIDEGYLTVNFNFLVFTLGADIWLGMKEDEDD